MLKDYEIDKPVLETDRLPNQMTIKFNKVLTDYLCINEEEAHKASSFSVVNHKELVSI